MLPKDGVERVGGGVGSHKGIDTRGNSRKKISSVIVKLLYTFVCCSLALFYYLFFFLSNYGTCMCQLLDRENQIKINDIKFLWDLQYAEQKLERGREECGRQK